MRPIQAWFDEYAVSHQNATNTAIHWICVPTIYFCVIGLLASIPSPLSQEPFPTHPWALMAMMIVLAFYVKRSMPLAVGMMIFTFLCFAIALWLDVHSPWPLWTICTVLFALAWIGQFIGHHIEGKKPSFLKDLQFLLIGPAWLLAKLYRRFGIAY
ncbi:MAG: DUF962 domain-containing protein [Flavobacteriales bacterium]|nr:DUF962 domain-containing protein [Flavobacteriales bacterium]